MANQLDRVQSDFMEARDGPNVTETDPEKKPQTLEEKIIKIVKSLVGWVPLIIMMALPKYAGYAAGYGASLGWSFLLQCYQFYCYRTGSVKIWPKILDVGMILISLSLLITELAAHPGDHFHFFIAGIIVNSALAGIVLFSIIIRSPFTLQFAKELVPKEKWDDPGFLLGCNISAVFWLFIFILSVISQIIPLAMGVSKDSTIELIFGTIGPIAIIIVGFKLNDKLLAWLKERAKQRQAQALPI